jgi:WD40 repeat protein
MVAPVSAGLVLDWKERHMEGNIFSGVTFSADGDVVYAGGSQMLLRSWSGDRKWGGKAGTVAAMSADSNFVLSANGNSIVMYDRDGVDVWTRNLDKPIRAVAISQNGGFVVEADSSGLMQSWARNGDFIGRNTNISLTKALRISRSGGLVVAATDEGLKFLTPSTNLIWEDLKNGNWDTLIAISDDGSTVITAGGARISSHSSGGQLRWMKDITTSAITDMAVSGDGSVIVIGDQEGKVQVIDRNGIVRWTFSAPPWINAVGISGDGRVIAVGSLDGYLYILDGGGKVTDRLKTDTLIQLRSLAVNRDGGRIAFADEQLLSGYTLVLDPEMTLPTRTSIPRTIESTETYTPRETATPTEVVTPIPTPSPTPTKAGLSPLFPIIAAVGAILVLFRQKD